MDKQQFCKYCGKKIEVENAIFCTGCGKRLDDAQIIDQAKPDEAKDTAKEVKKEQKKSEDVIDAKNVENKNATNEDDSKKPVSIVKVALSVFASLLALSLIGFGAAIFFSGREFFSSNSFDIPKLKWLGFLIAVPFAAGSGYLGHLIVKNSTTPYSWLIMCVMAIAIFLALVPGVTLLKEIFHRPRF